MGPVDSHNLYAFNGFDSINFVDPWGLDDKGLADRGGRSHEFGPSFVMEPDRPQFDEPFPKGIYCFGPACGFSSWADGVVPQPSSPAPQVPPPTPLPVQPTGRAPGPVAPPLLRTPGVAQRQLHLPGSDNYTSPS